MGRLLFWLLIVMGISPAVAKEEYNYIRLDISTVLYGSKNTTIKYGGILGAALDEIENQLRDQASQYIRLRLDAGIITQSEANRQLNLLVSGNEIQGNWADWFDRLPIAKGGLPFRTVVIIGPSKDFVDTGLFKIDNKFGFKLKDQTISIGSEDPVLRHFSFRVRPSASFSIKTIVNYVGLGLIIDYRIRKKKLLEVGVYGKCLLGSGWERPKVEVSLNIELPFE